MNRAAHIFFNWGSTVPSVGASGAIAGVLAGYMLLFPKATVRTLLFLGPFITMTRGGMFRIYVVNHIIHHRAFLCCYLRMNDIRLPGMYGPSGDE